MNIMFVAIYPIVPYYGGVQRVTDILSREMQKRGHNIIYVAYDREERMGFGKFSAPQYYVATKKRRPDYIREELSDIVVKHKIEYVICQNLGNSEFIKYLPEGLKVVTVCHTQPYPKDSLTRNRILQSKSESLKDKVYKYLTFCFPSIAINYSAVIENKRQQSAFDVSQKVCYISERFYYRVRKHLPNIKDEQLASISNPAVENIIQFKEEDKENLVIWVGRVNDSSKNPIDFLKAWMKVSKQHPDWKAVVIGEGPSMKDNKEYIRKHNISNIEYVGRRDDIFDFYQKAKLSVVTSWSESWSMVVIESMAHGCVPFVYDTYETIHDIIDNGKNGVISKPKPEALAAVLNKYIDDDATRSRMALSAFRSLDRFSVEKTVDQWELLLKSL
jgi:glycosyltransferase involved in cell wall biosynthesis